MLYMYMHDRWVLVRQQMIIQPGLPDHLLLRGLHAGGYGKSKGLNHKTTPLLRKPLFLLLQNIAFATH